MLLLIALTMPASALLRSNGLGLITAFDVAATVFLALCLPLLRIEHSADIEDYAERNDANRTLLLMIGVIVTAVLLLVVGSETVGAHPSSLVKGLIIATLIIAWLFSNSLFAVHYAHLAYVRPGRGCVGFHFPGTPEPLYWDFVYFAFTCGMAFATSDVEVTESRIRKIVVLHCLAAFAFNIGVLAFTVNLLASGGSPGK